MVVIGNFNLQSMNTAQQSRIKSFGAFLRKQFSVPLTRLYTHQEIGQTDCPGKAMQSFMVTTRSKGLI